MTIKAPTIKKLQNRAIAENKHVCHAAMNIIALTIGKTVFKQIYLIAKGIILDITQLELPIHDSRNLQHICEYVFLSQSLLGHGYSGATRAEPLLLKGSINPLRVRGRFGSIQE